MSEELQDSYNDSSFERNFSEFFSDVKKTYLKKGLLRQDSKEEECDKPANSGRSKQLNANQESRLIRGIFLDSNKRVPGEPQSPSSSTTPIVEIINSIQLLKFNSINAESHNLLRGNYARAICDPNGSRLLQKLVTSLDSAVLSQILEEIKTELPNLMTGLYSNYFCHQFYRLIPQKYRLVFIQHLQKDILQIATNERGTFALQRVIEDLATDCEAKLFIDCFNSLPAHDLMTVFKVAALT